VPVRVGMRPSCLVCWRIVWPRGQTPGPHPSQHPPLVPAGRRRTFPVIPRFDCQNSSGRQRPMHLMISNRVVGISGFPHLQATLTHAIILLMNTVKIYQLNQLSHKHFQRCKAAQMEAAKVWNVCMEAHKAARMAHTRWPGRDELQKATKGGQKLAQPRTSGTVSSETGQPSDVT
jgi:hypothetical protein